MDPRLLLLRHAKSSWSDDSLSDGERPLSARGERAATLMGVYLGQKRIDPSLVLCSSAVRARQTWERVAVYLGVRPELRCLDELYLASSDEILAILRGVSAPTGRVLVIGHNPGLEELAVALVGEGPRAALAALREEGLPTAGLVDLALPASGWAGLQRKGCRLLDHRVPKRLV